MLSFTWRFSAVPAVIRTKRTKNRVDVAVVCSVAFFYLYSKEGKGSKKTLVEYLLESKFSGN